jgi:hypothetical protein
VGRKWEIGVCIRNGSWIFYLFETRHGSTTAKLGCYVESGRRNPYFKDLEILKHPHDTRRHQLTADDETRKKTRIAWIVEVWKGKLSSSSSDFPQESE